MYKVYLIYSCRFGPYLVLYGIVKHLYFMVIIPSETSHNCSNQEFETVTFGLHRPLRAHCHACHGLESTGFKWHRHGGLCFLQLFHIWTELLLDSPRASRLSQAPRVVNVESNLDDRFDHIDNVQIVIPTIEKCQWMTIIRHERQGTYVHKSSIDGRSRLWFCSCRQQYYTYQAISRLGRGTIKPELEPE